MVDPDGMQARAGGTLDLRTKNMIDMAVAWDWRGGKLSPFLDGGAPEQMANGTYGVWSMGSSFTMKYQFEIEADSRMKDRGSSGGVQAGYTPADAAGALKDAGGNYYTWVQDDPNDLGSLHKNYLIINSGNQQPSGGSNPLSGPSDNYFYSTLTPGLVGSFVNDTRYGRWASMGGIGYSAASYNMQKSLVQEFSMTSRYVGATTKAIGLAGGALTLTSDGIGVYNYYRYGASSPNAVSPFHMAVDGVASYVGVYGSWPGALIS